ncbi:hypothetical protein FI667_g5407, partial [Globisporangium splendens]
MAEQTDPPPATTEVNANELNAGSVLLTADHTAKNSQVLLQNPVLLANVLAFLGSKYTIVLLTLNKAWARELMKPVVWEILAGVPHQPLLLNCFRRASSYCYREIDVPSPNVNRRGSPPVIRASLLNERTSMREYVNDLKWMSLENNWLDAPPKSFRVADVAELRSESQRATSIAFDNTKILVNKYTRSPDTRILTGGMENDRANFYLWSLEKQRLRSSIVQNGASCYHACNDALAIGCSDGTVRVWDFATLDSRNFDSSPQVNVAPTSTISHRSTLGMVPFIRTRSRDKVTNVRIDHNDGTFLHLATSTEKGEANVWDVTKGEMIVSIPASKIHKSALPRSQRDANPQITSLMLFRNTLVCGTSCGFIRVFDLRSSRLTHRLAGHPDAVLNTDTKGRVLWSAGREGTVRWWGGKTAKILSKSALCGGEISALEMDETVVVAGYSTQGMEAWDVRTQQSLCTFSNFEHGGVKSLQFDSRKLVTVSHSGKAALWRWYSPNPVRWFTPPTSTAKFISAQYDDRHLVFGTNTGDLLDFDRVAASFAKN